MDTPVTSKTKMKIRTTFRTSLWTVQKKEGDRWGTVMDDYGPLVLTRREAARNISREYRKTNPKAKMRVRKMSVA